jgi:hypothetical protein
MLITAFSLVIILPLANILNSEYMENKARLDEAQARNVLDDISIAAHNTHYAGYPSKTTLDIQFPAGVSNVSFANVVKGKATKSELVFWIREGESELVAVFPFRIDASFSPRSGKKKLVIRAEKDAVGEYINMTDYR